MDESAVARVVLAVFCDQIIEGKDGTLSLIRIIDRLTVTPPGSEEIGQPPVDVVPVTAVVGLRSELERKGVVTIRFIGPDGTGGNDLSVPIYLPGQEHGVNFVFRAGIPSPRPGVYWMEIALDGETVTRSPLRVEYSEGEGSPEMTDSSIESFP